MSHLTDITQRHGRDRVRDVGLIGTALLIVALALGITTSNVVGKPIAHSWSVTVIDPTTHREVR